MMERRKVRLGDVCIRRATLVDGMKLISAAIR